MTALALFAGAAVVALMIGVVASGWRPSPRGSDGVNVRITKHGRTSTIHYFESPDRTHDFDAELGAGDVLLVVYAPDGERWASAIPWAADRRQQVLERIAREIIRQDSRGSRFVIGPTGVDILVAPF